MRTVLASVFLALSLSACPPTTEPLKGGAPVRVQRDPDRFPTECYALVGDAQRITCFAYGGFL